MKDLTIIEHQGQRVLTTQQAATEYNVKPIKLQQNYSNNKERYQEGNHYFVLYPSDECYSKFSNSKKQTQPIYLWTERGCFLHAKSLGTDKAWEVYESLVNHYFHTRELSQQLQEFYKRLTYLEAREQERSQYEHQAYQKMLDTLAIMKHTERVLEEQNRRELQSNQGQIQLFLPQPEIISQKRRTHSKMDNLSDDLRSQVHQMLDDGTTYQKIYEYLIQHGIKISRAAFGRYAKEYLDRRKRLQAFREQTLALVSMPLRMDQIDPN